MTIELAFPADRFCRYDELTDLLHRAAAAHPHLMTVESIGQSHEGRELWLATITDSSTGAAGDKPAHWTDANIHATEVTAGVAALYIISHLLHGHRTGDATVRHALAERTFYVMPRVNPDGVEVFLADSPRYLRSSVRPWPWLDGRRWPGLDWHDVDGDGRILTIRIPDPNGAWIEHADDARVMIPVPTNGRTDRTRYRLLGEGSIENFDGFTIPQPRQVAGLDLNRNFPSGWGTNITGSGDFPGSEPETLSLIRAIRARPNICSYNAFHTFGGVMLRPSSTLPDDALHHVDLWTFTELGKAAKELSGYPVHSIYEDFTWDKTTTMAGAADDWAYDHLGVYAWTTEFWDVIRAATGKDAPTTIWWTGPTPEEELAVAKWADEHAPDVAYVPWYPFDHPQLGPIELGGADALNLWSNPPLHLLQKEVAAQADVAIMLATSGPRIDIALAEAVNLGDDVWHVRVGIVNTGWLPTEVTAKAAKESLVLPLTAEVSGERVTVLGDGRRKLDQLAGRSTFRLDSGVRSDGTPDRVLVEWTVRAPSGSTVNVVATHQRAGTVRRSLSLS